MVHHNDPASLPWWLYLLDQARPVSLSFCSLILALTTVLPARLDERHSNKHYGWTRALHAFRWRRVHGSRRSALLDNRQDPQTVLPPASPSRC